jgi:putative membrane protein
MNPTPPPPEQILRTIIHATGDHVPPIDAEQIFHDQTTEAEPEPLLPAAHSHWFTRLVTTALLIWLIVIWSQAIVWGWALNSVVGIILLACGLAIFGGFLLLGWQARRARHKLYAIAEIQAQFIQTKEPHAPQTGVLNLSRRIAELMQKKPQQAALLQALSAVDESWTYTELARELEHSYAEQDRTAARLIQREAIRTGIFIAASPYPLLDFLLVAWRNVAMVERVALIYHLKLSTPARWHLYQMILRNIAFTTVTETVLDSVSQSWLSNVLLQVGVRAGQGVGVALYSVRIGHQAMRLCRVVPESKPLVDRNIGKMVIDAVRSKINP